MVYYFFDSKEGLFTASALGGPLHPLHQLAALLDEGTEDVGPRLVRRFLERWDSGAEFDPLLTLWRSAAIHPQARKVLHDSLAGPMAKRVAAEFGVADAQLRVELVASHLAGLALRATNSRSSRWRRPASRTWSPWVGPTVQRYLTD